MLLKSSLSLKRKSFMGVFVAAAFFAVPLLLSAQNVVTIDETPPSSYPTEIVNDWVAQDGANYNNSITAIKEELTSKGFEEYAAKISGSGKEGYLLACHWRRVSRMKKFDPDLKRMICARHHDIGGGSNGIIGFIEELNSDGFKGYGQWGEYGSMSKGPDYPNRGANTAIMLLEFDNYYPGTKDLISGGSGVVRDPCPSYDGKTLVYAHSKDNNGYHIFDYDMETGKTRQLTDDLGSIAVSDFEPCVTPTGDIIFGSSRCFGHVDCNMNITSNLYIMNKDGKYLRRIGYDQVHTFYPTMMDNGLVMFTRWEYNDRNVGNCFGIFNMNQDGCRQIEWYGNQTTWPATFNQARQIPGEQMAIATIGGHVGSYCGDLVRVDISEVRNGTKGVELIAPRGRSSGGGGFGNMSGVPEEDKLFQNPYPLTKKWFLISFRKSTRSNYAVYLMNDDGDRELIAWDANQSVSQPISLKERSIPLVPNFQADYSKNYAEVSVADVYYGMAVERGVKAGDIAKIRVAAMEYRTDPSFGHTGASAYQMTPVGRYNCSWEAKWIVGEQKIHEDGSAAFKVPPNTPIFFQLIAPNGTCVQTMRSWVTLMPGERYECLGCHENKNIAPPTTQTPKAVLAGFKDLDPLFDVGTEPGSFYYPDVIQPILDKNCVKSSCHNASHKMPLTDEKLWTNDMNDADHKNAFRYWNKSYYNLFEFISCNAIFGSAKGISPRSVGSAKSKVISQLLGGHKEVQLNEAEMGKLCAWIDLSAPHSGTYTDDMKDEHKQRYLQRLDRRVQEETFEAENIEQFITSGGYGVPPYSDIGIGIIEGNKKSVATTLSTDIGFKARFLTVDRMLSLSLPSEGKIQLLDLKGREILKRNISKEAYRENAQQTMKLAVPAGTYIVKFDGIQVSTEQIISVL